MKDIKRIVGASVCARLGAYINVKEDVECWPWLATKDSFGYGNLNVEGVIRKAHSLMYRKIHGPIPLGFEIMHLCNNPACCNPFHLKAGTKQENMQHAVLSGSAGRGGFPNTTGCRGVSKKRNLFVARASVNGLRVQLYEGPSLEAAIKARKLWEEQTK